LAFEGSLKLSCNLRKVTNVILLKITIGWNNSRTSLVGHIALNFGGLNEKMVLNA
jgi:hypothetical protein